jgi:hypothetical protein
MWSGHSCLLLLMLILMLISKIYRTPQIRGGVSAFVLQNPTAAPTLPF